MKRIGLAALLVLVAALVIFAWSQRSARVEAERDLGFEASRVLAEKFSSAGDLRVATLSGRVVARGEDRGFMGMLPSEQRSTTPFSVDYFVDLSGLSSRNYRWDPATRTMTIDIPDVTVAPPNVDEARSVSQQKGIFISRRAALENAKEASARATAASKRAAEHPKHLEKARENARTAVTNLAAAPLAAAGLGDVRVAVSFPHEPKQPSAQPVERWDQSRHPKEVLDERQSAR
jgi:hypothetical protein